MCVSACICLPCVIQYGVLLIYRGRWLLSLSRRPICTRASSPDEDVTWWGPPGTWARGLPHPGDGTAFVNYLSRGFRRHQGVPAVGNNMSGGFHTSQRRRFCQLYCGDVFWNDRHANAQRYMANSISHTETLPQAQLYVKPWLGHATVIPFDTDM